MPERSIPARSDDHVADVTHRDRRLAAARSLGEIDMENLTREVSEVGGWALWWGVLAAQAAGDHERAGDHLKIVEAEVGNQMREYRSRTGEKFTVDSIRDEVSLHERVRAARAALIDASERASVLRAVSMSINGKQRTIENLAMLVGRELPSPESRLRDTMRSHRSDMPSGGARVRRQRA